jgi:hypothetical protein
MRRRSQSLLECCSAGWSAKRPRGASHEGNDAMPRAPRGKRSTTTDGCVEVVAKNSNGDGSVYFEPARPRASGVMRPGFWRASYRDADGKRRTVSGRTRVQAEARREVKLGLLGSILKDWPVTAADERWSLRSTPTEDSTSPTSLVTSAIPTRRRPPSTSAASATARRTRRRKPLGCSTRQSDPLASDRIISCGCARGSAASQVGRDAALP